MRSSRPAPATAGNRKASSRVLFADHDEDESEQTEHGGHAAGADEVHGGAAGFPGGRIVVGAEEKNCGGGPADPAGRGLDQSQAQSARLVLEDGKVPGGASPRP